MTTTNDVTDGALARARAVELLHGAVRATEVEAGWVRPWRVSETQMRLLGSTSAWHPGLFRQMARCSAGMTLEFDTDSTSVTLEVRVDELPRGSRAVIGDVRQSDGNAPELLDGLSWDVDGLHAGPVLPEEGVEALTITLEGAAAAPSARRLPGMGGRRRRVVVWLPALSGCELGEVWGDGTFLAPVAARPRLLVIGDSVAQGFVTGDPALSWPARLSRELGCDLLNQSIGGQVFQPGFARAAGDAVAPEKVVVALGGTYRFEPCGQARVRSDVLGLFADVRATWPEASVWAVTPTPCHETFRRTHPKSCFERVPSLIRDAAAETGVTVVDGRLLLDVDLSLMADASDHPNARGADQMAARLAFAMDAGALSDDDRRLRVLEVLDDAGPAAFPLREMAERGAGEVLFADVGCVLMVAGDGLQAIWGANRALARRVMRLVGRPRAVAVLSAALVRDVRRVLGMDDVRPCHLVVYESKRPVDVGDFDVRPLDASRGDELLAKSGRLAAVSKGELARALAAGEMLGGFEGEELVGCTGVRPDGSMGMLEVFVGHRRRGWGRALEGSLINLQLSRGQTPWGEVWPQDVAALALQERLGLTVYPASSLTLMRDKGE